jgi:hypothetical protein
MTEPSTNVPDESATEVRDISSDAFDEAYSGPKTDEAPEVVSDDLDATHGDHGDYTRADEDAREDDLETETDFA